MEIAQLGDSLSFLFLSISMFVFLTTLDNACTSGGRLKLYLRYWFTSVGEIIAFPCILPLQISLPNTIYLVVEASLYYSDWPQKRSLSLCFIAFSEQPSINLATACTLLKADCVLTPGTGQLSACWACVDYAAQQIWIWGNTLFSPSSSLPFFQY